MSLLYIAFFFVNSHIVYFHSIQKTNMTKKHYYLKINWTLYIRYHSLECTGSSMVFRFYRWSFFTSWVLSISQNQKCFKNHPASQKRANPSLMKAKKNHDSQKNLLQPNWYRFLWLCWVDSSTQFTNCLFSFIQKKICWRNTITWRSTELYTVFQKTKPPI